MENYWSIIIVFVVLWIIQALLTLRQQKYINEQLNNIKEKYDFGYLGFGMAKAKYNLGAGIMVLLVCDDNNVIHEFLLMQGVSVFAKFKSVAKYQGQSCDSLTFSTKEKKLERAFTVARQQIEVAKATKLNSN